MTEDRGQLTDASATVYEEFFVPALFGQWPGQVLDMAGVDAGDRVLDIACGTGVLARAALERVDEHGEVVGLDPNAGMLKVARRIEPRVDWQAGMAEDLPFGDDTFDRVVCQFGMMFFVDRSKAVTEMSRVLAPGGTVAVATWSSLAETPGYAAMVGLLGELFDDATADALRAPFVLGDPDELADLLSTNFPDVTVTRRPGTARFRSIDDWVHTDIRGWTLADRIADDQYAALLDAARHRLREFADAEGRVAFPAPALVAVAR